MKLQDRLKKAATPTTEKTFEKCAPGDYIGKIIGVGFKYDVERTFNGDEKIQDEVTFMVGVDNKHVLYSRPMKISFHEKSTLLKNLKVILKDNTITQDNIIDKYTDNIFENMVNTIVALDVSNNVVGDKTFTNIEFSKTRAGDKSITIDDYEINKKMISSFSEYVGKTQLPPNKDELLAKAKLARVNTPKIVVDESISEKITFDDDDLDEDW